jgi:2-polyprenyl-6-methoxyphenol hydroxylase-like FAD-dependent oxidoreductase
MQQYDAVIVGAGPAGLSTAIELLRKGWQVLLLDKETLPRPKVCGGFLGPENNKLLERCGVFEDLVSAGAHKVSKACLTAANGASAKISITLDGKKDYGLAVSRKLLDETLLARVKSYGGHVMDAVKIMNVEEGSVKKLIMRNLRGGSDKSIATKHLIYANGVNRKTTSSSEAFCFGVSAMFEGVHEMNEDVFLHFIEKGHLGTNRFEGGVTNVCYVADKKLFDSAGGNLEKVFQIFLEQNLHAFNQLSQATRVTPWKGIYVPKPASPRFVESGAFCVGDAVDVIHPIAGAGISLALSSGLLLGELMSQYTPESLPFEQVAKDYAKAWKKRFALRIKLSRVWAYLGHNVILANAVMRLFSFKKDLFDSVFKYHHRSLEFEFLNRKKEQRVHAGS